MVPRRWQWPLAGLAWAALLSVCLAGTSDTVEPVPGPPFGASATFLSDLQTFLRFEDGARYAEMFQGFVVKGCIGPVSPNLTHTPTGLAGKCVAYPGGLRIVEAGSVTYQDNALCWTIVHRDTTGNVTGPDAFVYTRVPGTHYAVNCTAPSLPQTPANSVLVMKVTTTTGAITAVADLRPLSPIKVATAGACDAGITSCLPAGSCASGTCCLPTASICDAAVTTPKLADGGVTAPKLYAAPSLTKQTAAIPSLSVNFTDGETAVFTLPAITTHGGLVQLGQSALGRITLATAAGLVTGTFKWYRDASVIHTIDVQGRYTGNGTAVLAYPHPPIPFVDSPGAGTFVYKLTVTVPNGMFFDTVAVFAAHPALAWAYELP